MTRLLMVVSLNCVLVVPALLTLAGDPDGIAVLVRVVGLVILVPVAVRYRQDVVAEQGEDRPGPP